MTRVDEGRWRWSTPRRWRRWPRDSRPLCTSTGGPICSWAAGSSLARRRSRPPPRPSPWSHSAIRCLLGLCGRSESSLQRLCARDFWSRRQRPAPRLPPKNQLRGRVPRKLGSSPVRGSIRAWSGLTAGRTARVIGAWAFAVTAGTHGGPRSRCPQDQRSSSCSGGPRNRRASRSGDGRACVRTDRRGVGATSSLTGFAQSVLPARGSRDGRLTSECRTGPDTSISMRPGDGTVSRAEGARPTASTCASSSTGPAEARVW